MASENQPAGATGTALFEYTGHGPLTMFGRITGVRYHFPGPGARVLVDLRDASTLEIVEGVERVSAERVQGTGD